MIPFVPDNFWPILYAGALAAVGALALWRSPAALWPTIAVMAANWLATRAVSAMALPGLAVALADVICAALLVALRRRTIANLPVAGLFLAMVLSYAAHDAGAVNRDIMWAWADVAGYLQLLIIAGAAIQHGWRHGIRLGHHPGRRAEPGLRAQAVRVQRETIS